MAIRKAVGSGEFQPIQHLGVLSIPASSPAGDLAVITPPAGFRPRIELMYAVQGGVVADITIEDDAVVVVDSLNLQSQGTAVAVGTFAVGNVPKGLSADLSTGSACMASTIPSITARYIDGVITISTTTTTARTIFYAVTIGV